MSVMYVEHVHKTLRHGRMTATSEGVAELKRDTLHSPSMQPGKEDSFHTLHRRLRSLRRESGLL